jgi:hypothetical protein
MLARMIGSRISSTWLIGGSLAGLSSGTMLAVGLEHLVDHGGRGGDQVEVVLALQALLHDLHVQHAEEAAAEAEAHRLGLSGSKRSAASLRRSLSSASRRSG